MKITLEQKEFEAKHVEDIQTDMMKYIIEKIKEVEYCSNEEIKDIFFMALESK